MSLVASVGRGEGGVGRGWGRVEPGSADGPRRECAVRGARRPWWHDARCDGRGKSPAQHNSWYSEKSSREDTPADDHCFDGYTCVISFRDLTRMKSLELPV